jgi:SAM-dependent methyltransferase
MSDRPISVDRSADLFAILRGGEARGLALAETLWRYLPLVPRTLEIGVGAGVVAAAVGSDGRWVGGVDVSHARLRRASRRLMGAAAQADAAALPVAGGSVDAVYMVWLQLVPGRAVVAEAARVLRPGGRLVVVTGRYESGTGDEIGVIERRLDVVRPRDRPADMTLRGTSAGLRLIERRDWVVALDQSPADAATGLEARDLAALWHLDDPEGPLLVAEVVAALRGMPDPDRPRPRRLTYPLLVFEKPVG